MLPEDSGVGKPELRRGLNSDWLQWVSITIASSDEPISWWAMTKLRLEKHRRSESIAAPLLTTARSQARYFVSRLSFPSVGAVPPVS